MTDPEVDFAIPNLAETVERLAPEQVNALPFGAIRLDAAGKVTFYSDTERRQSGYRNETVGHGFFSEIAPCMDNAAFRGRIERALQGGRLDIAFDYGADLPNGLRDVDIQVRIQSASGGGCWIFMQHDSEESPAAAPAASSGTRSAA